MKATSQSLTFKVQRAKAQTMRVKSEIDRWAENQSKSIYRDLEDDGRDHVYRIREPQPFRDEWLVVFGEILYDLRSVLDHLAYAIVPQPDSRTEFPITRPEHGLKDFLAKATVKLPGLQQGKPDAWDIIENLQPYQGASRGEDPKFDPLWILHELNIIDKHRYPLARTAAVDYATHTGFSGPKFIPAPDRLDFVEDDRVAMFRFTDPHPEINLHAEFTLGVFFGEVTPADETINQTLWSLIQHVQGSVIPPLVTYL